MVLYDLVQTRRGKTKVVMTDALPKVQDRMKTLRKSQRTGIRGEKVLYEIVESPLDSEKYKMKPHKLNLSGDHSGPEKVK